MAASVEIVIDAVDAEAVARFWAAALLAEVLYRREPYVVLGTAGGIRVLIQQVGPGASDIGSPVERGSGGAPVGRSALAERVHLDLRVDDPMATVERLVALGARVVHTVDERTHGGSAWTVLEDPWGLPFCVAPARPER
jgi:Glyoxalase-like domain